MSNKERIDYLLTKVSEDKKEAFVDDLKAAANFEAYMDVLKKYGISLSEEELKKLARNRELSDAELDATSAAGGGCEECKKECFDCGDYDDDFYHLP